MLFVFINLYPTTLTILPLPVGGYSDIKPFDDDMYKGDPVVPVNNVLFANPFINIPSEEGFVPIAIPNKPLDVNTLFESTSDQPPKLFK